MSTGRWIFNPVKSWRENDCYEDIFKDCRLLDNKQNTIFAATELYDTLYGQSWTLGGDNLFMWEHYSKIDGEIDDISVLLKTTVGELARLMDDTLTVNGYTISFDTFRIGPVKYLSEEEIASWVNSIVAVKPEDVMSYAVEAAFLKRKMKENNSYDYTREKEMRCLAWGNDDNHKKTIGFIGVSINTFSEYILDPRLSQKDTETMRQKLCALHIPEHRIHQSQLKF